MFQSTQAIPQRKEEIIQVFQWPMNVVKWNKPEWTSGFGVD